MNLRGNGKWRDVVGTARLLDYRMVAAETRRRPLGPTGNPKNRALDSLGYWSGKH